MYCNLLTRSYYSLAQSSISIDDIINFAKSDNQEYACLIDINVMYGAAEFYTKAVESGLKPVIGLSIYIDNNEIVLIANNYEGYKKLCQISSVINHNQKVDLNDYACDDLCVISNKNMPNFNNSYKFDDLAINEALFVSKSDFSKYKAVLAINQDKLYKDIEDDQSISNKYLLNQIEANKLFNKDQLDNLDRLLSNINLDLHLNKDNYFVKFSNKYDSYDLLQERCRQGLILRFGQKVRKEYIDRIKYELDIIHKMGFDDYFLVVQDYVAYAKQNNIAVGPGRGSAAGSLVSYVLQITDLDPLEYGLIFERFLNSQRKTKPDIDIDFMDNRRQEIFDYLFTKYGNDRVAHIVTFQTIKIKSAIRDIARILDIDLKIVNLICKTIPDMSENLKDTIASSKALAAYVDKYPLLFELADYIIGMPRQTGMHAAGVVIANQPLSNIVPTMLSAEGLNTTQYSMEYIEPAGLIKMDILGLVNLSIINDCVDEINKNASTKFDLNKIPLNDSKVFKQLCLGNTIGIFQLESPGMTNVVRKIQPKTIEDISVASALFRPGPQANIPLYIKNRNNPDNVEYIDDKLSSILKPTYGIIVYQEQVIQTLCAVANWSLAQADIVRRAISKKKIDKLNIIQDDFIKSAIANGYSEAKANKIFEYILRFASYGFNHSHSLAYSLISYQLAYLKTYYPLEFYTCLLTYNFNSSAKLSAYLAEAKNNGITACKPSINHSVYGFSVFNKKILFGFGVIKGVGSETISKILKARANVGVWKDLKTCLKDLANNGVGVSAIEIMTKAGCFDELFDKEVINRTTLLANLEQYYACVKSWSEKYGYLNDISITKIQENKENTKKENDDQFQVLGIAFAAHPIIEIKENNNELNKECFSLNYILNDGEVNKHYKSILFIKSVRKIKTKTGLDMAFISLEDETASCSDAVTFGNVINAPGEAELLVKNKFLLVDVSKSSRSIKINKIIKEVM